MRKCLFGLAAVFGTAWAGVDELPSSTTYEGLYLGAGVNYQHTTCKIIRNDYLGQQNAAAFPGCKDLELAKSNAGKFGGSILCGYGAILNGCCYLGAELTLDISDDSKQSYDVADNRFPANMVSTKVNIKVVGFVPTVVVRAGWIFKGIDTLVYARLGGAYVQTKADAVIEINNNGKKTSPDATNLEKKRFVPVVGLGFEKNVGDRWNVRLEGDWRFSSSKEKDGIVGNIQGAWLKFKNKSDGYAVRMIVAYVF